MTFVTMFPRGKVGRADSGTNTAEFELLPTHVEDTSVVEDDEEATGRERGTECAFPCDARTCGRHPGGDTFHSTQTPCELHPSVEVPKHTPCYHSGGA